MRAGSLREAALLVLVIAGASFCVFDEEPILDLSDWSLLQVLLLVGSIAVTVFELVQRARFGQSTAKDQAALVAALTFWFSIENYLRAIIVVFFFHSLIPFEAELFELIVAQSQLTTWLATGVVPSLSLFVAALVLSRLLGQLLAAGRRVAFMAALVALNALLLASWLVLSWDLLCAGLSSLGTLGSAEVFYLQSRSALTYDHQVGAADQFEWHCERARPFAMRFEDLYVFVVQLFNCLSLAVCVVAWWLLSLDLAQQRACPTSFTFIALGTMHLEHAFGAFACSFFCHLYPGLRLAFAQPFEFGIFC
jgi:hypothetical protein